MPRYPLLADILEARRRLHGIALETPLEDSPTLAAESGAAEVRLKLELLQPTGSFKTRGAHNKVALIAAAEPEAALVTASSGNHGIATATAAARHGMRLTVLHRWDNFKEDSTYQEGPSPGSRPTTTPT